MLNTLLQAQAAQGGIMGEYGSFIMIGLIFVVFYFFMIRPQSKKQKEIQKFRDNMKTGDKVITAGGIHGKIKDVKDATITLEIADNVRITIDKASVFATADDTAIALK